MAPAEQGQEIEGAWTVLSAERDGNPMPHFVNARFVFRGDRFGMLRGERRMAEGTYRVDSSKDLKEIDLIDNGTRLGVYKLEGDQLTLCFAEPGSSARPAVFAAAAGTSQTLFVLRSAT